MTTISPFLGDLLPLPIYQKESREHYPYLAAETSSLTDRVLKDDASPQIISFHQPAVTAFTDFNVLLESYNGMIEEHIQRKVLFFFQQLIVSYNTPYHFESVGALDQAESTKTITIKINGTDFICKRDAAHSSSNPCLVAYNRSEWEAQTPGNPAVGYIYLHGTDYYKTMNSTMGMLKCINDTDSLIEHKGIRLREKANAIINRNAKCEITPDQGVKAFVKLALEEVQKAKCEVPSVSQVRKVLDLYESNLEKIRREINSDPDFVSKFLSILPRMESATEDIQRNVLELRYEAIRNCQINQAFLIQKIEGIKNGILASIKKNQKNAPDNFSCAFKAVFVSQTSLDIDRIRLEKLLNYSIYNSESQLTNNGHLETLIPSQKTTHTKYQKTKAIIQTYSSHLQTLAVETLQSMEELRRKELNQRVDVLVKLRKMHNWTQKELGEEIHSLYPDVAWSQQTISDIENQVRPLTHDLADIFSKVFKVSIVLFTPEFFYE